MARLDDDAWRKDVPSAPQRSDAPIASDRADGRVVAKRTPGFTAYCALVAKDVRQELRTHDMLTSMGLYSVVVLMVFGVMFMQAGDGLDVLSVAGGLVWALIVLASLMGLGRSFSFEREQGCLEGVLLAPIDRSVVYLAKLTTNLLFLGAVEAVTLPPFWFFFLVAESLPGAFALSVAPIVLGTVGISAVGTLLSTITMHARGRDVLLAVLFVPAVFPLLYCCVAATSAALLCPAGWEATFFNGVVGSAGFDVIMSVLAWLFYDYVVSA